MNIRNQFLVYSTVVPYAVALLSGACATRAPVSTPTLSPPNQTLTERTQERKAYNELTDLLDTNRQNLRDGTFEINDNLFYIYASKNREAYSFRLIEPTLNTHLHIDKSPNTGSLVPGKDPFIYIEIRCLDRPGVVFDLILGTTGSMDKYFNWREGIGHFSEYIHVDSFRDIGDAISEQEPSVRKKRIEMSDSEREHHDQRFEYELRKFIRFINEYLRLDPQPVDFSTYFKRN